MHKYIISYLGEIKRKEIIGLLHLNHLFTGQKNENTL
jgi:hypothetical protein